MKKVFNMLVLFVISITILFTFTGCMPGMTGDLAVESTKAPEQLSAPWNNYEELLYVSTSEGKEIENCKYIINLITQDGEKYYKIDRTTYLKEGSYKSGALLNFKNLNPVSSFVDANIIKDDKPQIFNIKGQYLDVLAINTNGKTSKVKLPKQYFDNEYLAMAIREFSIKDGFSTDVNICNIWASKVGTLSLRVTGKEKIKVPYGEVECYKLDFYVPKKTDTAPLNFWISTDEKRNLIRYGQPNNYTELKSIKYNP
jgi:hypothetical protein